MDASDPMFTVLRSLSDLNENTDQLRSVVLKVKAKVKYLALVCLKQYLKDTPEMVLLTH